MATSKTRQGEGEKRRQTKQILVITDENELPVTYGSKVPTYLTMGLAKLAIERLQVQHPDRTFQISIFVPQSSRLIFMDGDEK